ncbi:unnamed protein product, partial [Didymodactylos carnosus]
TSVRKETFLARSHLGLFQICGFVHWWVHNTALSVIEKEMRISKRITVDWSSFCCEVVFDEMIGQAKQLGGNGSIVEIDKSKFGRRKHYRGHRVEGQDESENEEDEDVDDIEFNNISGVDAY